MIRDRCSSCLTILLWSHGRLVCVNANCTTGHEPAQQELPREAA